MKCAGQHQPNWGVSGLLRKLRLQGEGGFWQQAFIVQHDNHHLPPHHHCQVYPELDEALLTRVMGTAKLTIMEENSFSGEESFLRIYEKYFPPNFTSGFDSRITSFFPIINFQGTMISRILSSQLTQTLTRRLLGEASFEGKQDLKKLWWQAQDQLRRPRFRNKMNVNDVGGTRRNLPSFLKDRFWGLNEFEKRILVARIMLLGINQCMFWKC